MKVAGTLCLVVLCFVVIGASQATAQNSIRLREAGTNRDQVQLQIGQSVTIEILADLGNIEASGIAVFVTVPRDNFIVTDQRPVDITAGADTSRQANAGHQPFVPGPLFEGAGEQRNLLVSSDDALGVTDDLMLLDYRVVLGPGVGAQRSRSGQGVVATFQLRAIRPAENSQIRIHSNPISETRVILADGGERQFRSAPQGMEINILGLELFDIPDVILLPGEADSVQIGSLNTYVSNVLSPIDSLKWSFSLTPPVSTDSLEIEIDPNGNIVKVRPLLGWSGRTRVIWTAQDSIAGVRFPGPVPSSFEFSDIIVNNPPVFVRDFLGRPLERGPDGVKRDTVRFREDEHTFIAEGFSLDARIAFKGVDLDRMVDDPDLADPDDGLVYAVSLPVGTNATNARIRGDDDQLTHQLLVWALPDFSGVDSLRVLVQDEARGRDTLRVIVEVEGVADAPEFILPESERNPRISRGSTRNFRFDEIVRDVDTPLDSLVFRWVDDPEGHFFADTTRSGDGSKLVQVTGDALFVGDGRVSFEVADPDSLKDTMIIFFEAAEALPPDVFPSDFPIRLSSGGGRDLQNLDDFVEDPDNADNELGWAVPPLHTTDISVNEARQLSVQSPPDFVGYESVDLTVSDPGNQTDKLTLRIYSSDGRPVVGGIPDIVLDRGDQNKDIDLDDYSHDADNTPQELTWQVLGDFDRDNLQVGVAPLSNLVTFFAPESAIFRTETVIFQVIDPGGRSWQDTVLVTVKSGGKGGEGLFEIKPAIGPLQAEVGLIPTEILDLDDHLTISPLISRSSITWNITRPGSVGFILLSGDTKVIAFSDSAGTDTVEFVATDSLGRTEKASTTVRYFGLSDILTLRSIPDISFIAGGAFSGLQLNDFIFDSEAHPDSVIEWSAKIVGDGQGLFIKVNDDNTVTAFSSDTLKTEVVFIATNTAIGVTGRDTINVIAQDPSLATLPLKEFTEIVIAAGDADSTITLNDFLPDGTEANTAIWSVSGQTITIPFIDPLPPHKLTLTALGNRIGSDTLSFSVELGGGFRALGDMVVRVVESPDEISFSVRVIPNATNVEFLNLFVMSRAELASIPSVVFSFGTTDTTVAVTQIETQLESRGILIWSGRAVIPPGQAGEVTVSAQAKTQLGTDVQASASVVIGTATAGKAIALRQGDVEVTVPAGAVERDTKVLLQRDSERVSDQQMVVSGAGGSNDGLHPELTMRAAVNLFPVQLDLKQAAALRLVSAKYDAADGLYRQESGKWVYVAGSTEVMSFSRFGRYAIMRDGRGPEIQIISAPTAQRSMLQAMLTDGGSGVDLETISVSLDGVRVGDVTIDGGLLEWTPTDPVGAGDHYLEITVQDRAANRTTHGIKVEGGGNTLPTMLELGNNYPNPFNPETTIPFIVPDWNLFESGEGSASGARIRLAIYNTAGQMVRLLLDDQEVRSGSHEVLWDGRDADGRKAASGVYLYRVEGGAGAGITKRMTLLK